MKRVTILTLICFLAVSGIGLAKGPWGPIPHPNGCISRLRNPVRHLYHHAAGAGQLHADGEWQDKCKTLLQ